MTRSVSLQFTDLSCTRGDNQLFHSLSGSVTSRQCLHVVGPNGRGKTSLLRILSGLLTPDSGLVSWNGDAIEKCVSFYQSSAFIGHKDALKNELSAIENLRFAQHLNGSVDESLLDESLDAMQILQCADLLAQQLSFGQRRRLSFAKLLLGKQALWILDEPFTGIDVAGRELIEHHCRTHLQNDGLIILTHHQSLDDCAFAEMVTELDLEAAS